MIQIETKKIQGKIAKGKGKNIKIIQIITKATENIHLKKAGIFNLSLIIL